MRVLYVTTVGATMEFFADTFRYMVEQGHEIELACSSSWDYKESISCLGFKRYDIPFSRSPFSKDNLEAYKRLKKVITDGNYDIVHCHTPNASAVTRLACKGLRKKGLKVIYTAHGFHFYKGAPLKNWLLYYPAEWLCAHWTDMLITINKEDFALAEKHMHAKSVKYLPGVGIDLSRFSAEIVDRAAIREKLHIPENYIMLLSVGELNKNKNHELFIRAIAGMERVVYFIAGKGDLYDHLNGLIKESGLEERVKLLGFRSDVNELLRATDIFVMPSFREGLSVSLMEAMASGLPCAVSRIRGNTDLIDEYGGRTFDPHSIQEAQKALADVISLNHTAVGRYNQEKIHGFTSEVVCPMTMDYYREVLEL